MGLEKAQAASNDAACFVFGLARGSAPTEGVSHRDSGAKQVIGVELKVVLNMVVVNFGAHKKVVPGVVAEARAQVLHEVISADIAGADRGKAGCVSRQVKPVAREADAAHEVQAGFLAQLRLEEGIDVGQDGPVLFIAVVVALFLPPRNFDVEAEAVPEKDVGLDAGIDSTFFRWRRSRQGRSAGAGGEGGPAANGKVNLLGMSENGGQQDSAHGCDGRELSQYSHLLKLRSGFGMHSPEPMTSGECAAESKA